MILNHFKSFKMQGHNYRPQDPEIYKFKFFDFEQCEKIFLKVLSLAHHWMPRSEIENSYRTRFYTLGSAFNFDFQTLGNEGYLKLVAEKNKILNSEFSDAFLKLKSKLESALELQLEFDERVGLPFFNIFIHPLNNVNSLIHADSDALELGKLNIDVVDENATSIIIPISLPRSGSGINTWRAYYSLSNPEYFSYQAHMHDYFTPYEVGKALIFNGMRIHQGVSGQTNVGEFRITLQARIAKLKNGKHLLFW